jgi:hypothetical protein
MATAEATRFICPQCGEDTETLREGCCEECREANQAALDRHNAEFDRWQSMTDAEREDAIRWTANHHE